MSSPYLDERFLEPALDARLKWMHPPPAWRLDTQVNALVVEPLAHTDFWQRTHYGFRADNGHFLGCELTGDFVLSTQVAFKPVHQYDQAGLMIRASAECWIKASVEHEWDQPPQLGTVVTNLGFSDWSLQDFPLSRSEVRLRMQRRGGDMIVEYGAQDEADWKPMRVAHLATQPGQALTAGIYACSPKGGGFQATFKWLTLERT